jgi:hypothetical protein
MTACPQSRRVIFTNAAGRLAYDDPAFDRLRNDEGGPSLPDDGDGLRTYHLGNPTFDPERPHAIDAHGQLVDNWTDKLTYGPSEWSLGHRRIVFYCALEWICSHPLGIVGNKLAFNREKAAPYAFHEVASIALASYQLEHGSTTKAIIKRFSYTGGDLMDYLFSELLIRGGGP